MTHSIEKLLLAAEIRKLSKEWQEFYASKSCDPEIYKIVHPPEHFVYKALEEFESFADAIDGYALLTSNA